MSVIYGEPEQTRVVLDMQSRLSQRPVQVRETEPNLCQRELRPTNACNL